MADPQSSKHPAQDISQTETASTLSADEIQLRAQGHKGELPRQFSAFAMLAVAFSITNSWIGYSAAFLTPLFDGGGPTVFWGLIVAAFACSCITAGMAELASAYPSTGGQYHFAFMVSPPKSRAFIAFVMGWLSVLAWVLTTTSAAIFCAQVIGAMATFYHEDFVAQRWQIYLIFVVITLLTIAIVVGLPTLLPKGEIMFFLASLIGFLFFFIAVLATSKTKQSARTVFITFTNLSGWSDGTAFMLGVGSAMYSFVATDTATHLAEEIPNPGRNVPRVMGFTMLIGICTSIPWTLAFMFSSTDLTAVGASSLPIYEVYRQALDSHAGATFFACWLLFVYFGATIACTATAGRLTWAFARDNGLPFSKFLAVVHPTLKVPANATVVSGVLSIIYGVIYVASTTAFNSIISMCILSLNVTYVIPQAIVLYRGREKILPKRHFNLGPILGPFCNAFSTLWIALYTVLFCLPSVLPVAVASMNYVSVVVTGIVVAIALFWIGGKRKVFVGPDVVIDGTYVSTEEEEEGDVVVSSKGTSTAPSV